VSFRQIEACGLQAWRVSLREEVASKRYRLDAVRRATISKGAGDESLLGIPTIRDRIVPTAVKLVLELIVEADFEDYANGYRPACGAVDAVKEVHRPIPMWETPISPSTSIRFGATMSSNQWLVASRIV